MRWPRKVSACAAAVARIVVGKKMRREIEFLETKEQCKDDALFGSAQDKKQVTHTYNHSAYVCFYLQEGSAVRSHWDLTCPPK